MAPKKIMGSGTACGGRFTCNEDTDGLKSRTLYQF